MSRTGYGSGWRSVIEPSLGQPRTASREFGGVLAALNGWHCDPFAHRPDMVGKSRGHGRRLFPDRPVSVTLRERSDRPTEIITVHREIGHRLVHTPVLRERVRLAGLPRVVVPVGGVLPL